MAKEVLCIPEDYLREVIDVIRLGIISLPDIREEVKEALLDWCIAEENYLDRE
jgi:hypothetical protein